MNEQIVGLSKSFLVSFLKFCVEKRVSPVIVGGWAVWAYTQTDYSVDIDLVLRNKKELEKIKPFFEQQGFKQESNGGISFAKQVSNQGMGEFQLKEIIFDVAFYSDKNTFAQNKNLNLPWRLVEKNVTKTSVFGFPALIPSIELLLVFKTKALIDREYLKYKLKGFENALAKKRREFKIEKDKKDIQNLIDTKQINQAKLEQILRKAKFKELFDSTIKKE